MQAWASAITLLDYVCLSIPFVNFPCLLCAAIHARTAYLLTFPFMATRQMPTRETFVSDSLQKHTKSIYMFLRLCYYTVSKPLAYTYCCTIFFPQSLCPHLRLSYCLLHAGCTKGILFSQSFYKKCTTADLIR